MNEKIQSVQQGLEEKLKTLAVTIQDQQAEMDSRLNKSIELQAQQYKQAVQERAELRQSCDNLKATVAKLAVHVDQRDNEVQVRHCHP